MPQTTREDTRILGALARSASYGVLAAAVVLAGVAGPLPGFQATAFAQDDGEGPRGPQGDTDGGQGQGGQGAQSGQGNQGGGGAGQGGPGDDSDGVGPQAGGPSDSSGGGQPPWASEGIPEVELGRLSVARSPDHVLDSAYDEALATIATMADFYNMTLDQMVTELSLNFDSLVFIDSPLQNLAIFRDALDGSIDLSDYGITQDAFDIMAVTLGVASDKTIEITWETAYALSVIFEMPMTQAEAEALAEAAEEIRIAVLAGHG
ncbi:hypothetical protein HKCCE3408_04190 [Rhodobacterales bacterium HKCCE3408]|nr:hypothetical protein [Rhodobacterales bacterium HKCCE3408]